MAGSRASLPEALLSGDVGVGSRSDRRIYAVKMIATVHGAVVTAEMSATVPVSVVALSAVETSCIPQIHSGVNAARHGGKGAGPVLKAIDDGRYAPRKRWAIDRQRRRRNKKRLAFVRRQMLGNGLTMHAQLSHLPRQERCPVTCAHEHTSAVRSTPDVRSPDAVHRVRRRNPQGRARRPPPPARAGQPQHADRRPPPMPSAGSGTPPAAAGQSRPAAACRPPPPPMPPAGSSTPTTAAGQSRPAAACRPPPPADAARRIGHAARRRRPEPASRSTPTAAPRRRSPQGRARRAPPPARAGRLQHADRRPPPMPPARPGTPRAAAGQRRSAAARRPPAPAPAACRTLQSAPPPARHRRPLHAEHRSAPP